MAMIDRKLGRDNHSPHVDEVAAMRAEIERLREELPTAKAAQTRDRPQGRESLRAVRTASGIIR